MLIEIVSSYIWILLTEMVGISLLFLIKRTLINIEHYEVKIKKPIFVRKIMLGILIQLLALKIKRQNRIQKSLLIQSISLFVLLYLFNLSYTRYFGWNLVSGSQEEFMLDVITGLSMAGCNWMIFNAFFPKRKQIKIQINKKIIK